ncbi:MAG: hypothetical protein SFV18_05835 [Bryobacteraceae bacterium]|nr:hypothetical protein [Bryobacteraceae bacterium]
MRKSALALFVSCGVARAQGPVEVIGTTLAQPAVGLGSTAAVVGYGAGKIVKATTPEGTSAGYRALGGAGAGALTGMAIGSVVPGIGTLVGGGLGAVCGAIGGWFS